MDLNLGCRTFFWAIIIGPCFREYAHHHFPKKIHCFQNRLLSLRLLSCHLIRRRCTSAAEGTVTYHGIIYFSPISLSNWDWRAGMLRQIIFGPECCFKMTTTNFPVKLRSLNVGASNLSAQLRRRKKGRNEMAYCYPCLIWSIP